MLFQQQIRRNKLSNYSFFDLCRAERPRIETRSGPILFTSRLHSSCTVTVRSPNLYSSSEHRPMPQKSTFGELSTRFGNCLCIKVLEETELFPVTKLLKNLVSAIGTF